MQVSGSGSLCGDEDGYIFLTDGVGAECKYYIYLALRMCVWLEEIKSHGTEPCLSFLFLSCLPHHIKWFGFFGDVGCDESLHCIA